MLNTRFISSISALLCVSALLCASAFAAPQGNAPTKLYKWVDEEGKVHYTERLPQEATGKATSTMNRQGTVLKERDRALTKEELLAKQEAERRSEDAAKRATEERRKNEAVLSSYESVNDIEKARVRAMESNADVIKSTAHNVDLALKRQAELAQLAVPYKENGKKLPGRLALDMESNEMDLKGHQQLLDAKKKEAAQINARYDEDKRRFIALRGGAGETAPASTTTAARR